MHNKKKIPAPQEVLEDEDDQGQEEIPKTDSPPEQPPSTFPHWGEIAEGLKNIEFLWPGWLPLGFLSILAGEPGVGKSALALSLAKCVINGGQWPDGQPCPNGGKVIWLESEGSLALNLERARRIGIPLENLISPFPRGVDDSDFQLDNPAHLEYLREAIKEHSPSLIILDSLTGSHRGKEQDANIHHRLKALRDIAEKEHVPILIIHHVRKAPSDGRGALSLDDLRGSSAIGAMARVVIMVEPASKNAPEIKRVSQVKNNLAPHAPPFGVAWANNPDGSDGLVPVSLPVPLRPITQQERAGQVVCETLKDGPAPIKQVREHLEAQGFNWETVRKAAHKMGIVTSSVDGVNCWSLP